MTRDGDAAIQSALRTVAVEAQGLAQLRAALENGLGAPFREAVERIRASEGRVIVSGMGKSGHVGRKIAATLASTGTPAYFVHPAEASHGDLGMIRSDDVILALSWSGETAELSDLVEYSRRYRVSLVAITSRPESALASRADVALVLPRSEEACPNGLAPTTSTTMQLVLGDALAVALLKRAASPRRIFARSIPVESWARSCGAWRISCTRGSSAGRGRTSAYRGCRGRNGPQGLRLCAGDG